MTSRGLHKPSCCLVLVSLLPGGDSVALVSEVGEVGEVGEGSAESRSRVRRGWRVDLGRGVKVKQAVGEDAGRLRVRRTDGVKGRRQTGVCFSTDRHLRGEERSGECLTADVGMIQRGVMAGLGCCTGGS